MLQGGKDENFKGIQGKGWAKSERLGRKNWFKTTTIQPLRKREARDTGSYSQENWRGFRDPLVGSL